MKSARDHASSTLPFSTRYDLNVVRAPDHLLLVQGILDGKDRIERLKLDLYGAPCFFKQVFVRVREQNHRLFGMVHDAVGEIRLVMRNQRHEVLAGDVLRRNDGEFIPGDALAECNPANASTSAGAADGCAVQHSGEAEIVHVARLAGYFVAPFFSGNGSPHQAFSHSSNPRTAAAVST